MEIALPQSWKGEAMKASKVRILSVVAAFLFVLAAGSPVFAGDGVIHKGADVWMTVAGFAKTSFAQEPIPAGFFCEGSKPFTGTVEFKGAPLAAEPAGSLGSVDTVVRRLDDAIFDGKGEAKTRIQLMALSLVSTKPVETSCGAYDVAVTLAGEQPTTTMKIVRTEALGGTYSAPLALNVKVAFTPVSGKGARRELTRRVDLGPANNSVWTYVSAPRYEGDVRIDTNGDGRPDAALPAASNFLAGVSPAVIKDPAAQIRPAASSGTVSPIPICPAGQCAYQSCHCTGWDDNPTYDEPAGHCESSHLHCVWVCVPQGTSGAMCAVADEPVDPAS
jgi:hypothetical protein